ncbi:hypothetical protein PLICRDRAFT_127365 [Plicaturopsis crispa FD-325 SS-3]|uniref:F-box domain-containing protein n=1 Tax=Plicaturopsis crispa FD-325 SS-3 TaxID=944288 RepID=A0A0C9T5L8_PLICR|nr:hypothetical protein PLICRDRAFT_127365 [Plicaturopsis crispa FD-325 SS-3]
MDPTVSNCDEAASFSPLPSELIIHIFDIAAATSTPTALTLCLVASWTCKLARRHLLDTVVVSRARQARVFLQGLHDAKDRAGSAAMVHHLWILQAVSRDSTISQMPNLTDLAITPAGLFHSLWKWGRPLLPRSVRPSDPRTGDLRLTLISFPNIQSSLDQICRRAAAEKDERERPALLSSVTHLSCALLSDDRSSAAVLRWAVPLVRVFPRLTHLAICLRVETGSWRADLEQICAGCTQLQALVVVITAPVGLLHQPVDLAALDSLRERFPCLYVTDDAPRASWEAWVEEIRTGNSIWKRTIRQGSNGA